MTSVVDGRVHSVPVAEFERGLVEGRGRYRAVCGAEVVAASMAAPCGARCAECGGEADRAALSTRLIARLARRFGTVRAGA